jgi:predicted acyltransferase
MLIIGVLMANSETVRVAGLLPGVLWTFLMYLGIIFTWNESPMAALGPSPLRRWLKTGGIVLLLALALLYRGQGMEGWFQLRPQWWGIIGLIGWAYWVSCTAYWFFPNNLPALLGLLPLFYCVDLAMRVDTFPRWMKLYTFISSTNATSLAGLFLGASLLSSSSGMASTHEARKRLGLGLGVGSIICAYMLHALKDLHPMFYFSKDLGTPGWSLLAIGATCLIWVLIYELMDVRGITRWARLFRTVGENPLLAYILQPLLWAFFELIQPLTGGINIHQQMGLHLGSGMARAVLFAFGICWLAGWFKRRGIQLRL